MATYIIAGLGNPGDEYEYTRHNAGRIVLEQFRSLRGFPSWEEKRKYKALVSEGAIGKHTVLLLEPDNFMNNSGKSVSAIVTSAKKAEKLVVVYDDIDLPLGTFKISFNRGSGGHRGVESIIRSLGTKAFIRVRVGVAPITRAGKVRKPVGGQRVLDFLMGNFNANERKALQDVAKKAVGAIEMIVIDGKEKAMGECNAL